MGPTAEAAFAPQTRSLGCVGLGGPYNVCALLYLQGRPSQAFHDFHCCAQVLVLLYSKVFELMLRRPEDIFNPRRCDTATASRWETHSAIRIHQDSCSSPLSTNIVVLTKNMVYPSGWRIITSRQPTFRSSTTPLDGAGLIARSVTLLCT